MTITRMEATTSKTLFATLLHRTEDEVLHHGDNLHYHIDTLQLHKDVVDDVGLGTLYCNNNLFYIIFLYYSCDIFIEAEPRNKFLQLIFVPVEHIHKAYDIVARRKHLSFNLIIDVTGVVAAADDEGVEAYLPIMNPPRRDRCDDKPARINNCKLKDIKHEE